MERIPSLQEAKIDEGGMPFGHIPCAFLQKFEKYAEAHMLIDQYQRTVNSLDKEIADLEKKKSAADKKAVEAQKRASSVSISKTASAATVKSKIRQIEGYQSSAIRASAESADLSKKIADKRTKRNEAALRLQREEIRLKNDQDKAVKQMQQSYERRIEELKMLSIRSVQLSKVEDNTLPEYDVFVSHAWEDKIEFVDEFVEELCKQGAKVWYDTSQIKWGDSMRAKIDDGLKKSKFGVVILSPDYIKDGKYWTKAELDGLFQLESVNGKMLLPIWHNLTKKEVMAYSPIIASKLAMTTATMTPAEIAAELLALLPKTEEKEV